MLILPEEHRRLFKEPFGIVYPSIDEILPMIKGRDIYAVGDVVTHNLQKKGIIPSVAVVDGFTMRISLHQDAGNEWRMYSGKKSCRHTHG